MPTSCLPASPSQLSSVVNQSRGGSYILADCHLAGCDLASCILGDCCLASCLLAGHILAECILAGFVLTPSSPTQLSPSKPIPASRKPACCIAFWLAAFSSQARAGTVQPLDTLWAGFWQAAFWQPDFSSCPAANPSWPSASPNISRNQPKTDWMGAGF